MRKIGLALLYLAVIVMIVVLADRPQSTFIFAWVRAIPGGDKFGHFLLMGGLSFVVNHALSCRTATLFGKRFLLGSLIVAVLVSLEECSQLYFPSRTFDLLDLTSDFLGIWLFGCLEVRMHRSARA